MKETRFKQTEIGLIPEDWEISYVENECKIETGSKNTQDKKDNGKYPFYVRSEKIERINTYSYDCEAVLTAGDGVGTGKVFHYINGKFEVHQRVYIINEFSNKLNGLFFYLYFSNNFLGRIKTMTAKSSVDSVRKDMINKMQIPLPLLYEQEKIASALTSINNLLLSLDKMIEKKRLIKQGAMQELLTGKKRLPGFTGEWVKRRLGEIANKITTGKLDANAMVNGGKYPFFTCAREVYRINTFAFDEEVLLISGNGANVGYIHYYKGKFNAYQRTYILYDFSDDIQYIKAYLDKFLCKRIETEKSDSNTPFIKMDTLTEMYINIPQQLEEQKAIATVLSSMDKEIESLEGKKAKYEQIKQGMMQQLLTGKIRLIS